MKTCVHGHTYDPELTYAGRRGMCPVCQQAHIREWQNRKYQQDEQWREQRKQRSRDKYNTDFVYRAEKQMQMTRRSYKRNTLRKRAALEELQREER